MSSYPSLSPVIPRTMSNGKITRPGDIVEKMEKNWRIAIAAKKLTLNASVTRENQNTRTKAGVHAHVGHSSELLQQVPGEEGDDRVLGGDDLVRPINVFLLNLALVVSVVCR